MNLNTLAFASAARLVLAALLGWATSRGWIPVGPTGNTIVLDVGSIAILGWSVYEGATQARDIWSNVVAFARDIVAVSLNWAAGMGYIGKGDVVPLEAALGTIVLYVWSIESKHLNLQIAKVLPFLMVGMLALGMYGCAGGTLGGDSQQVLYNIGEDGVGVLDGLTLVPALPHQACTAAGSLNTAWLAGEQIVINGNGDQQKVIQNVQTALAALVQIGLQWGITSLQHAPAHAHLFAALQADPTPAEWAALNAQIAAGVSGLHCS